MTSPEKSPKPEGFREWRKGRARGRSFRDTGQVGLLTALQQLSPSCTHYTVQGAGVGSQSSCSARLLVGEAQTDECPQCGYKGKATAKARGTYPVGIQQDVPKSVRGNLERLPR